MLSQTSAPVTIVQDASLPAGASLSWGTLSNISTTGASYATFTKNSGNAQSFFADCTNFGFNIPIGSTIRGIQLSVMHFETNSGLTIGSARDNSIMLIVGGTAQGNDKADTVDTWPVNTATQALYGGIDDFWGISNLTLAQVNSSTFGVAFSGNASATIGKNGQGNVNTLTITIFYEPPMTWVFV